MKMKGNYASGTTYAVGDVVKFTDNRWYWLHKLATAGTPCTNTEYWYPKDPTTCDLLDIVSAMNDQLQALNPDAKSIVLGSSTASSTKKMKITVVNDGTISASEVS